MEITLALGSGGVGGFAHLGVIRALTQAGYRVKALAGTSIGGLVSVVFGSGFSPQEILEFITGLDQNAFYRRSPGDGPGLLGLSGVRRALRRTLGERRLEDLPVPVAVTAVDLETGELVALREGPAVEAVLATIAIPGAFPPQSWNGRDLIDGGVLDPVPVQLARTLAPDLPVVAVPLSPPMANWTRRPPIQFLPSIPFLSRWIAQSRYGRALSIYRSAMDMAFCSLTDLHLERTQPEVTVRPQTHHISTLGRFDISELIQLGERAAERALPEVHEQVRLHRRLGRLVRSWVSTESSSHRVA